MKLHLEEPLDVGRGNGKCVRLEDTIGTSLTHNAYTLP
jgi:hypothetical protein